MRPFLLLLCLFITIPCLANSSKITLNGSVFNAELAITGSEHRQGLTGRRQLKKDQAMLFIYSTPRQLTFWMKGMIIPLDILFFDSEGKLTELFANAPPCTSLPCKTYTNQAPALYVLELPAGTSTRLNIQPGDTFKIVDE